MVILEAKQKVTRCVMVATMDIAGHIAVLHGHQVRGVTLKPIAQMIINVAIPMMTVNAHTKSVGVDVGADLLTLFLPFSRG